MKNEYPSCIHFGPFIHQLLLHVSPYCAQGKSWLAHSMVYITGSKSSVNERQWKIFKCTRLERSLQWPTFTYVQISHSICPLKVPLELVTQFLCFVVSSESMHFFHRRYFAMPVRNELNMRCREHFTAWQKATWRPKHVKSACSVTLPLLPIMMRTMDR